MKNNLNLTKEFEKIEMRIANNLAKGHDITNLLRTKARLLFVCYHKMQESFDVINTKAIAPFFAQELAFLNNIKQIQTSINDNTNEVDIEINKVHSLLKEKGLFWLIENMPNKK